MSVQGEQDGGQPNGTGNAGNSFKWMGDWTKKKLTQARKAQSQISDLLSMPARRYKELSSENAALRRRIDELSVILNKNVHISGSTVCGQVLAVKGGELGPTGYAIGLEQDGKLLEIQWSRKMAEDGSWNTIPGVHSGFYQTSIDDVGCRIGVELHFTELYCRLAAHGGEAEEGGPVPTVLKLSETILVETEEAIQPNPSVEKRLGLPLEEMTGGGVYKSLVNVHDPLKSYGMSIDMKYGPKLVVQSHNQSFQIGWGNLCVCALPGTAKGVRLFDAKTSSLHEFSLDCSEERDFLVGLLRKLRAKNGVQTDLESDLLHRERVASMGSLSMSTGCDSSCSDFTLYDCMYQDVWDLQEFRERKVAMKKDSSLLSSMSSILSSALDPLQGVEFNGVSSRPSSMNDLKAAEGPNPNDPVSFDLYTLGGFDDKYSVDLDLQDGEGLGITLSLHVVVRGKSSFWPKAGATCICISDFCTIVKNGEECEGQLQSSGLVRPGDALVAINGVPVEPNEVKAYKDLESYEPCSLKKVAKLVNKLRYGTEDPDIPNNPKAQMRFTFAQGSSRSALMIKTNKKLKAQVDELKTKLRETYDKAQAIVLQCDDKIDRQNKKMKQLCSVVEDYRDTTEKATLEKQLVADECQGLKEQLRLAHVLECEQQQRIEELEHEKEGLLERIARLEASMADMAHEGEAWVNTIGTKEDALRKLECELQASKVQHENLQSLVDAVSKERDEIEAKMKEKICEKDDLRQKIALLEKRLSQADEDADVLTARLRHEADEGENQIRKLTLIKEQNEVKIEALGQELTMMKSQISALKEANTKNEALVNDAHKARQTVEVALNAEKAKLLSATQKVMHLEACLAAAAETPSTGAKDKATKEKTSKKEEPHFPDEHYAKKVAELEGANEVLRAQVRSFKTKVQSLAVEAGKAAQLDSLIAEKNDLLVQVQLERAQRLEAEDELVAYKRALRQFAEQAKKDQASGNGDQWTNRPKIFDHLYKSLLSQENEQGSNKKT